MLIIYLELIMKNIRLALLCSLSFIVLPVIAFEHVDNILFAKKEISFSSPLLMDAASSLPKHISVISQDANGEYFEANLNSLTFAKVVMADGVTYNRIQLPDSTGAKIPGEPNVESYSQMLSIPNNAEVRLFIENIEWSETFTDIIVDPTQLPIPDVALINGERPDENIPFVKNDKAYSQFSDHPQTPIQIVAPIHVRGKKNIVINYQPVDFDPLNKSVRFATKVNFHLEYMYPEIMPESRLDPILDRLKALTDMKPSSTITTQLDTPLSTAQQADYLIITPPDFIDAITPLAQWKRQMGYQVYVASTEILGNNQEEIKAFIKDAYDNGTMTSYVLLVGDHEDLPAWEQIGHPFHGKDHKWYSDFEYSLLDGDDNYADIVIGRLPGDTAEQITAMVNKTLIYQKNPAISERYNHVLLAGQFQDSAGDLQADRLFMEDLHRLADFLGPDYDFFDQPEDPFNKGFQIHTALKWDSATNEKLTYGDWSYGPGRVPPPAIVPQVWKNQGEGNRADITSIINSGVGFVMHRDHGYAGGEGWADPEFTSSDVDTLTNNALTPIVFSLNCATGWFDGKDTFAESWMRNTNGGAVGFTGAARVSYSGYNDLFHVGIMDTFWDDYDTSWSSALYPTSWKPAIALNRAKDRVFTQYSDKDDIATLTARLFGWFGDPELELRTTQPQQLYVNHDDSLIKGKITTFDITVRTYASVTKGARVALVFPNGKSLVGYTNASGRIIFSNFKAEQSFEITVTEHNGIPYQATVNIEPIVPLMPVVPVQTVTPTSPVTTKTEPTITTSAASIDWMLLIFMITLCSIRNYKYSK